MIYIPPTNTPNWYKDILEMRTKHQGEDIGYGREKNLDEKFWQDIDLWYQMPLQQNERLFLSE